MTRILTLAGALLALGLATAPAHASTATWVSGKGADSGSCSFGAPCRSFAYAITQTDPGGEIDVLDSAGYGTVTVDKAISIANEANVAKVSVGSGATGITINAGPNDVVHLRGLTIEGSGVGAIGIQFNTGASLEILDCVVRHLATDGIFLAPTTQSTFSITNSFVADIGGTGVDIRPLGSAVVAGIISGTTVKNTDTGIAFKGFASTAANDTIVVQVVNSVVDNAGSWGFYASASFANPSLTLLLRSVSVNNSGIGVYSSGGRSQVILGHSTITTSSLLQLAWKIDNSGHVFTNGDNDIIGLGVPDGSLQTAALQ